MDERIKTIAEHYGLNHQCNKLLEEMSELSVAIYHVNRNRGQPVQVVAEGFDNFIEELIDVDILMEQIKYLLRELKDDMEKTRENKLNRQIKRIEDE